MLLYLGDRRVTVANNCLHFAVAVRLGCLLTHGVGLEPGNQVLNNTADSDKVVTAQIYLNRKACEDCAVQCGCRMVQKVLEVMPTEACRAHSTGIADLQEHGRACHLMARRDAVVSRLSTLVNNSADVSGHEQKVR